MPREIGGLLSCVTPVSDVAERQITTIAGLSADGSPPKFKAEREKELRELILHPESVDETAGQDRNLTHTSAAGILRIVFGGRSTVPSLDRESCPRVEPP